MTFEISPLGFEITPDIAEEYLADPTRLPSSIQTPEHKAQMLLDLEEGAVAERHLAVRMLAAWDEDPEVAAALRPLLASDDVLQASQAATGLARQRDITDLPAVLDLVYRLSPADGGTAEAMLLPLRAAIALAALEGPHIVEGVRSRGRTWRGSGPVRRQSWEHEFDRELDDLLAEG